MELLNFIAERRERQGCFSHLGDSLLGQRHIIPLQEQLCYVSSWDDIKLYQIFSERRGAYSESHTVHNLLRVTL